MRGFALLALAAVAVFAQAVVPAKFEVVSIKPSAEQAMRYVRPMPGGRLTASAPVRMLIQNAFALQAFQIVGGPQWIDSDRFQVDAAAAGNPPGDQLLRMLQPLLEDRFQLLTHRQTRELPVLALVAARRGPKLPQPKEGACADPASNAQPEWSGGRMAVPGQGSTTLPPCGAVRVSLQPSGARLQGGKVSMAELVRTLSMITGQPVRDRTGIAASFDLQLDFLPDANTPALPPPPPNAAASQDPNSASLVTAIQEQLGLRLEPSKGPVEVLVIDRIERPTAN
jgi:uncharacterized protein (TIGR03435 family)